MTLIVGSLSDAFFFMTEEEAKRHADAMGDAYVVPVDQFAYAVAVEDAGQLVGYVS
jgi:hypothetical protein